MFAQVKCLQDKSTVVVSKESFMQIRLLAFSSLLTNNYFLVFAFNCSAVDITCHLNISPTYFPTISFLLPQLQHSSHICANRKYFCNTQLLHRHYTTFNYTHWNYIYTTLEHILYNATH